MRDAPFVSIILAVRNEASFIGRSLAAVLEQDYPRDRVEIIIADGGSEDDTRTIVEALRRRNSNLYLIDNPGKIVSCGLNLALRIAKGEIIVRIDGHCEIARDYVSRCVEHLQTDGVDCVGGPVVTVGETYVARVIAAAMSSTFGVGGSTFRVGAQEAALVDTVPFPGYRRETIERAGPFDEELVRNQDDEYSYRLRKNGGRILLAPDIQSRYYSRASLRKLGKQYFEYGYWKVRVLQKHARQMSGRQFVPPLFVLTVLLLGLTAPLFVVSQVLLATALLAYAVVSLVAALLVARKSQWSLVALLPIAFAIIHVSYGAGFLLGMLRFWKRWGDHSTQSAHGRLQEYTGLP
jgi:glycosyltransferase involved in cell wall biosynthesis